MSSATSGPTRTKADPPRKIRNSADDEPSGWNQAGLAGMLYPMPGRAREAHDSECEYIRLFVESQDVARSLLAEVKRLRKFIAEEFLLDATGHDL